jgi:hypothetical protein
MSALDRIIDSAKSRFDYLMHGQSKPMQLVTRSAFLGFVALFIATFVPTNAQDLNGQPDQIAPISDVLPLDSGTVGSITDTSTDTTTVIPSAAPDSSSSPLPSSLADSSSATVAAPFEKQPHYVIHAPASIAVDPRAQMGTLPTISASGSEFSLICLAGSNLRFDALNKRVADAAVSDSLLLGGDLSGNLRISGKTADALALFNSLGGTVAYSASGGIAGKGASLSFVAMSAPGIDPDFCDAATNSARFTFRALDLAISKGEGAVKLKN